MPSSEGFENLDTLTVAPVTSKGVDDAADAKTDALAKKAEIALRATLDLN